MSSLYQFDVPQGPIRREAWYAWSLGTRLSEGLDKLDERGIRPGDEDQYRLVTDGGRNVEQSSENSSRCCTTCGRSVEDEPYMLWLFHTCSHCALDATPERFGLGGTARKWLYKPTWHRLQNPSLPSHVRERLEAEA